MTQPTPETSPQHGPSAQGSSGAEQRPDVEQPAADEQPTVRLAPADPEATRPMSLADLLNSD